MRLRLAVFDTSWPLVRSIAVAVCLVCVGLGGTTHGQQETKPLAWPQLLVKLPEICPTPDGMALDAEGNIILACPNYADQTHPAVLMKIDRRNRVRLFCQMPTHPDSGVACPMGIAFGPDGNVASNTRWAKDPCMKSIDGICVDEQDNIYVADFSNNAVCVVSPQGKVRVLAKSPDCDGWAGGLDQPGEPLLRGREVIVSNFDMVTGPDKLNSGHDYPYTLSVIKLGGQP